MAKLSKEFQFNFPLTQKVVRDLRIVTEHVGDLTIEGVAYCNTNESIISEDRYSVDIDYVKWNGTDIRTVLEIIGGMDGIGEAALRHCACLFTQKSVA